MELELATYQVNNVNFGPKTKYENQQLTIDETELRAAIAHPDLTVTAVDLASPGEKARIIHILDTVEPRCKVGGDSVTFPGILGAPLTVGSGRTNRLGGLAVDSAGHLPDSQEAIVDMSGPGARFSPLSQVHHVVLRFEPVSGVGADHYAAAVRWATVKCASYLAQATLGVAEAPASVQQFKLGPAPGLPSVAFIMLAHTIRTNHTWVYGHPFDECLPVLMHPNEFMDGAVVAENHHFASYRNVTYFQQNHAALAELYAAHGRTLNFRGVLITRASSYMHEGKVRLSQYVAKLCKMLAIDGAISVIGSGGHGYVDQMMICKACEEQGVKTVLMLHEMAGKDGRDFPLVDETPEANAIVTAGSYSIEIDLPPMDKVAGGREIMSTVRSVVPGQKQPAEAGFRTALREIYCATLPVGNGHLTTRSW